MIRHLLADDPSSLLRIYLNDHLAGAVGAVELAGRCRSRNAGAPVAARLDALVDEIQRDRVTLEQLMRRLGFPGNRLKLAAALAAERIGRLKLNGRVTGYSPLSRLIELEALALGVENKRNLWLALRQVADDYAPVRDLDLDTMEQRASAQRDTLQQLREEAAREAFADRSAKRR